MAETVRCFECNSVMRQYNSGEFECQRCLAFGTSVTTWITKGKKVMAHGHQDDELKLAMKKIANLESEIVILKQQAIQTKRNTDIFRKDSFYCISCGQKPKADNSCGC